jgi:hypothetical protein
MPSVSKEQDYFGQASEITPPSSAPSSVGRAATYNFPPSPEESDSSEQRRQVMIFSGMNHFCKCILMYRL